MMATFPVVSVEEPASELQAIADALRRIAIAIEKHTAMVEHYSKIPRP